MWRRYTTRISQFCDASAGDYHLWDSSPCVDGYGCGQIGALGIGCSGRVWLVDGDGVPGIDCDCTHIQACVDSASTGDMVLVAEGTYEGENNRDIDFAGKNLLLRSTSGAQATSSQPNQAGPKPTASVANIAARAA